MDEAKDTSFLRSLYDNDLVQKIGLVYTQQGTKILVK
jgi:hypothetical protein